MDQKINIMIEKMVNKPITPFQRELVKVGLLLSIFFGDMRDLVIYLFYPVGFYYGWRTMFKMLKGNASNSTETGIITAFFSGSGYWGIVIGLVQFFFIMLLAIFVGWIVGYINLAKTLLAYKNAENINS